MGTDIHTFIEVKPENDYWQLVGPRWHWWWDQGKEMTDEERKALLTYHPYTMRNYNVFAMLASVRNGMGFAGMETGGRVEPIAQPKGLPDDPSPQLAPIVAAAAADDHTHPAIEKLGWLGYHDFSYLTLAELDAYAWHDTMQHKGIINLDQYAAWRKKEPTWPEGGWSAWVSGGKVVVLDPAEADDMLDSNTGPSGLVYYVRAQWSSTRAEAANGFYPHVLDEMRDIAADRNATPDGIRLVFGFDS